MTQLLSSVESLRIFWSDVYRYQFKHIRISVPVGNDHNRLGRFATNHFSATEAENLIRVSEDPLAFVQKVLSNIPRNDRPILKGIHLIPFCGTERLTNCYYEITRYLRYIQTRLGNINEF